MGFILLWLFSVLMSIVNGQTCAAFFDYRGDWLPFGFCFNLWDASSGRSSMQFMCNTAKTNITRVFWDGFDCIGAQRFNFTDSYNNGYIPSYDPGSVFCQQDYPVCSTNQVAVVNAFDIQQTQCDNNDFSGAIEFRQEYSSYALDMCFNYTSGFESRLFTCDGLNVMRHEWNSAGCSGSPASITNAVTYQTCVAPDFDAVIQCGATTNTLITGTWTLNNYPLDPTDSPTLPPVQSPIYNGSYYDYNDTDSYTTSAGVAGLFAFFTFLCCCGMVCCICSILMCCILRCVGDTEDDDGIAYKVTMGIYYIFWFLLILPFKAISFGCSKIFSCHGCSLDVAKRFFAFLPNLISTIIILSRFGSAQSGVDFEKAASEGVATMVGGVDPKVVQGLAIIILVLIGFIIKAKDFYISYQTTNDKDSGLDSEIVKSLHIKNLQAVIITSSDTLFKIFAGLAIIVGSDYSGIDEDSSGESIVVTYIKGAAVIGAIQEFIDMADEYLTKLVMFLPKAETSNSSFSCEFSAASIKDEVGGQISGKLTVDSLEPGAPAQSAQKTILWNAMWAGTKLFLLLIEQLFAFIAACILAGQGDVIGFIVIVIICIFGDVLLAAIMCTKYQRLSVGLCCKYYFCCLYDQCDAHCEKHWIKLDPVEKGLGFNTYGGVTTTTPKTKPKQPEIVDKMGEHQELNTENNTENTGKDAAVYGDSGDKVVVDLVVAENQNNANDNDLDNDDKNDKGDNNDDTTDEKKVDEDYNDDKGVVDENDKGDNNEDYDDDKNDKGDNNDDKGVVDENVDDGKVDGDNDKGDVDDGNGNDKGNVNVNDAGDENAKVDAGDDNAQDYGGDSNDKGDGGDEYRE